jgi:L-rhamnose mutarotase
MKTMAFCMSVDPAEQFEYERRHNPIWPDLERTLKDHGVHHYSIFLNPATSQLFAYVEIESEERWEAIAQTEVCQRWWAFMKDIMPSNPDNSPVSQELTSVFYLE